MNWSLPDEGRRNNSFYSIDDSVFIRDGSSLQDLRVGHGDIGSCDMLDGGVHVVEGVFVDEGGESLAGAVVFPALLGYDHAIGFLYRVKNEVDVNRADASQVEDFGLDAFFGEIFGSRQRDVDHTREGDNRDMLPCTFQLAVLEWYGILDTFIRHFAFDVVE